MNLYKNNKLFSVASVLKKKKLLDYNLLTKFNFYNLLIIPKLSKIVSTITLDRGLKSDVDIKIINVLTLLDILLGKKSSIVKLNSVYIRRQKTIIFVSKSTLNNWYSIYSLLYYLKKAIIPYLKRKFINLNFSITDYGFVLLINDISSLDELPDNLKKEKISIKFSFFFKNNYGSELSLLFLNFLGFTNKVKEEKIN